MKTTNASFNRAGSRGFSPLVIGRQPEIVRSLSENQRSGRSPLLFVVLVSLFMLFSVPCAAQSNPAKHNSHSGRPAKNQENGYFDAQARATIQPGVLTADKVSATSIGDVLTLLFNGAKLSLQNESEPLSASWVGSIRVPTKSTGKNPTSYLQHIRGFVGKDKDSRVTILLDLGSTTHILNFPYGSVIQKDFLRQLISGVKPRSYAYAVTLLILIERRNPKSAVMVSVDSLDVEAKVALKPKKN